MQQLAEHQGYKIWSSGSRGVAPGRHGLPAVARRDAGGRAGAAAAGREAMCGGGGCPPAALREPKGRTRPMLKMSEVSCPKKVQEGLAKARQSVAKWCANMASLWVVVCFSWPNDWTCHITAKLPASSARMLWARLLLELGCGLGALGSSCRGFVVLTDKERDPCFAFGANIFSARDVS